MIVPVNEESNLGSNVMKFQLKQIPDMITRNNYEDERKCQVVIVLKVSAGALARNVMRETEGSERNHVQQGPPDTN